MKNKRISPIKSGFTLIELLIVIAILGVLAVVVLVAINPVQQLARTRDAGRISSVSQLGHAIQAYYTAHGGEEDDFPAELTWNTDLVNSGELNSIPSEVGYTAGDAVPCPAADNQINGTWCYDVDLVNGNAIVYAALEALTNTSRCATGEVAVALYSTSDGRGGTVCDADGDVDPQDAGVFVFQ